VLAEQAVAATFFLLIGLLKTATPAKTTGFLLEPAQGAAAELPPDLASWRPSSFRQGQDACWQQTGLDSRWFMQDGTGDGTELAYHSWPWKGILPWARPFGRLGGWAREVAWGALEAAFKSAKFWPSSLT